MSIYGGIQNINLKYDIEYIINEDKWRNDMKKIILVGLGEIAKDAIINLGIQNIAYVYDNYMEENIERWENIPALRFDELLEKS